MGDKSKIEWTDASWNPVRGCTVVSEGCKNCYAMRQAHRMNHHDGPYEGLTRMTPSGSKWTGKVRTVPELLELPLRWKRPRRIFVNSMSDLFHEDVPFEFVEQVWDTMFDARQHVFQILTKRPERMVEFAEWMRDRCRAIDYPNVWLGTSVENQEAADERIPVLLDTPTAVRWLSCEPLLGPIDLRPHLQLCKVTTSHADGSATVEWVPGAKHRPPIHWAVVGGESGPGARPMHPQWARSLRDQCIDAGVPFFFKQWGNWTQTDAVPGGDLGGDMRRGLVRIVKGVGENDGHFRRGDVFMRNVGKHSAGRELDGRTWDEYPIVHLPSSAAAPEGENR